jgi:hypothetical protein
MLFELRVERIEKDADWLTREGGPILPSVRDLFIEVRQPGGQPVPE